MINFGLVDVPGYGYAKVSKTERAKWGRMIEEYHQQRESASCSQFSWFYDTIQVRMINSNVWIFEVLWNSSDSCSNKSG